MQFKLLNFHKMLSNFAVNIIGVFIPLILFTYTGNVVFSLLYLVLQYTLRIVFTTIFRKAIEKRPQLFLLLRVVPMLIYASSVFLLDYNIWLAISLVLVFGGISDAWSNFSNEVILNYSSLNKSTKSFGLTRAIEQIGVIASVIMGGLFLDNVGTEIVVMLSIGIYLISVIPLTYYYFKYRNTRGFNSEAISNAYLTSGQKQTRDKRIKRASKQILSYYFWAYVLMCFIDSLANVLNIWLFTQTDSFTFASFVTATFNGTYGLSSYFVGKLNEKRDITTYIVVSGIIIGALVALMPFVPEQWMYIILFAIIGLLYPLSTIFFIERLLVKTRILGISNEALFQRETAVSLGKIGGLVLALAGGFVFAIIGIGVMYATFCAVVPVVEEKSRKLLINFLEGD